VDHGHHAAVRIDAFRRSGGYDEGFSHNEDAELDCRLKALGFRLYLDCATRVGYRPRSTFKGLFTQYYRYGAGRSRTVRRHPSSMRLRQIAVPGHLFGSVVAVTVIPWSSILLVWPALYLLILAASSLSLAARHRSVCGLLAGPVAFVMHTAWAIGFFAGLVARRETKWRAEMAVPL
jgi:succinoglycan biosynthesis protein ExoA